MKWRLNITTRVNIFLILVSLLIVSIYLYYPLAPLFIFPVLIIAYYNIIKANDFSYILILMLISRCIMGFVIPGNKISFNLFNILCNYLPLLIFLAKNWRQFRTVKISKIFELKYTVLYVLSLFFLSLINIKYSITEFPKEVLPITLFLIVSLFIKDLNISFQLLLKFFKYTFVACIIVYLNPKFDEIVLYLFNNPIIFKEGIPVMPIYISGMIPRNTGFVFDFRIQAQFSVLYFLILYYSGGVKNKFDIVVLSIMAIITFSRGPIVILILVMLAAYVFKKIRITPNKLMLLKLFGVGFFIVLIVGIQNTNVQNYMSSFNPFAKHNAFSQRGNFSKYAINKFKENPYGRGIGELSSSNAKNKIDFGFKDAAQKEPLFYYKVGDAYWALSLGEKGIFGLILFILSSIEIFFYRKNMVSLFFILGLYINLIGTDIPKQGFFYFVIIIIYYQLSIKGFFLEKETR